MEKSYFDGTVLQHFGYSLLAGMFTAITFGIGAPWAFCGLHRWETKHTVVESKRLEFDGKGLQLFLLILKLMLLPILILIVAALILRPFVETKIGAVIGGITFLALLILSIFYGSYAFIQLKKWIVGHTFFQVHVLNEATETTPKTDAVQVQPVQIQAPPYPDLASASTFTPWETQDKDWTEKISPVFPFLCALLFCGIAAGVFLLLKMIFQ